MPRFKVTLRNEFHAYELYDSRGQEVFNLGAAIAVAEETYGSDWNEVFNGLEGAERVA